MNAQQQIEELKSQVKSIEQSTAKLEQQIKPTIEVGKVYKDGNIILIITEISNSSVEGFGFNNGKFSDFSLGFLACGNFTEATTKEWFSALEKEAERRGYKDGVKVISVWSGEEQVLIDDDSFWDENGFLYKRNYILNTKGEWATICEEEKEIFVNVYYKSDINENVLGLQCNNIDEAKACTSKKIGLHKGIFKLTKVN